MLLHSHFTISQDGTADYICICPSGYTGDNCNHRADSGTLPNIADTRGGSDTGMVLVVLLFLLLMVLVLIAITAIFCYIKKRKCTCTGMRVVV